jgi:hypothetical protein
VLKRTNKAMVSPPTKRMNSAPSPLMRLSSAKLPLLPYIIESGKIAAWWVTWDNMTILRALGHLPSG